MREIVLNHASFASPDRHTAVEWLRDVTIGMTQLTQQRIAESSLRMCRPHADILCMPGLSLFDALQEMLKVGAREEYILFSKLTSKIPLLIDVGSNVKDRFRFCEAKTLPPPDGDPLVLAAITDGISVGFPSEPYWDKHQIVVTFDEMLPDESIQEASETIDNLTRSAHAEPIGDRHRDRIRDGLREFRDGAALWKSRQEAFPNLVFGPDVKNHLAELDSGLLGTIVNKLSSLDESGAKWRDVRGAIPSWGSKVTDESKSVKNNDGLREARRFRSHDGTRRLFTWHARYGSSGRIHLRFEPGLYEMEIGYIGPHLPL